MGGEIYFMINFDLFVLISFVGGIIILIAALFVICHIDRKQTEEEYINQLKSDPSYPNNRDMIKAHRATDEFFKSYDFVLEFGEIVAVKLEDGSVKLKVGDGTSKYSELPFV